MQTVVSKDGTSIAYEKTGSGPAIILVGTTASDHHDLDGLAGLLSEHFTVYNYDRRGRGGSGDTMPYAPAREIEDVEALLDAIGEKASLVSGSAGCVLALDIATALGGKIDKLFLYEPSFIVDDSRPPVPADYVEHVTVLVQSGKRSEAVEYFMTAAVGVPAEYIEPMKADPSWELMVKYAHTLAYDGMIVQGTQDGKPLPRDRWRFDAPAAVAVGANSPPFFHEGAKALTELLPSCTYMALEGLDHSAFWMSPDKVTEAIREFFAN
ncbi:alpha/beta fold hydrolase [Paenibacillus sp. MSJ-34]|uniref:alpha/beta fold hydrolase n=1 Tax=Paenibacillus sp. MSJ-34 TaxID=2841529 RepID=UPI001C11D440|nr:alpha/beta hydrolase [Paenibacillus sp. MSJ-34]MBU5444441.1 alpha/beta hydrolase [Paenibacillus sp. MSJ-34]